MVKYKVEFEVGNFEYYVNAENKEAAIEEALRHMVRDVAD